MGSAQRVIWVTGGCGYIGSVVVQLLLEGGHSPVIIDNFSVGVPEFLPKEVPYLNADVVNGAKLSDEIKEITRRYGKPHAVIHLAAKSDVNWCESNPGEAYEQNVAGTYSMAKLACAYNCRNFIFASSAAVYGNVGRRKAYTLWKNLDPVGIYGQTKLDAEKLLNSYFKNHLSPVALRFFNVAGAAIGTGWNRAPRGVPNHKSSALIPTLVRKHLAGGSFSLGYDHGLFFNTSPVRDFIHVRDVASNIISAALHMNKGRYRGDGIQVWNVGRGREIKIHDFALFAKDKKKIHWYETSPEQIPYSVAGKYCLGDWSKRTVSDMWVDEMRWQQCSLFKSLPLKEKLK